MTRQGARLDDIATDTTDVPPTPDTLKAKTSHAQVPARVSIASCGRKIVRYLLQNRSGMLARYQLAVGRGFKAVWDFGEKSPGRSLLSTGRRRQTLHSVY